MKEGRDGATFWNGEPCEARRVRVIVADSGRFPAYWARDLAGQEREAVEVCYFDAPFYIDNADGSGWRKVTEGRGSPSYYHGTLEIKRVLTATSNPTARGEEK